MQKANPNQDAPNPVVLFDGVCNLCNASVRFLLAYNRTENLRFAPLQSDFAKEFLAKHQLSNSDMNTVVFVENDKAYTKSTAAFEISKHLIYPWRAMYYFRYIPKNITDWVYVLIARNRYQWFGKKEKCMMPKPEWEHRFF